MDVCLVVTHYSVKVKQCWFYGTGGCPLLILRSLSRLSASLTSSVSQDSPTSFGQMERYFGNVTEKSVHKSHNALSLYGTRTNMPNIEVLDRFVLKGKSRSDKYK